MSDRKNGLSRKVANILSAGGVAFSSLANPVNLMFVILLFVAGFALFNERIVLVCFISTLALLTVAFAAGILAMLLATFNGKLPQAGFRVFSGLSFLVSLALWSQEIFRNIPATPWPYTVLLAVLMLAVSPWFSLRLQTVFRAHGIL